MNSCFWFHDWSKWVDQPKGDIVIETRIIGQIVFQERRCTRCNALAMRTVRALISGNTHGET